MKEQSERWALQSIVAHFQRRVNRQLKVAAQPLKIFLVRYGRLWRGMLWRGGVVSGTVRSGEVGLR